MERLINSPLLAIYGSAAYRMLLAGHRLLLQQQPMWLPGQGRSVRNEVKKSGNEVLNRVVAM